MTRLSLLVFLGVFAVSARAQTLTGFARLAAQTFVSGPTSGQKIEVKDGLIALPFAEKQPIQGFSSLARMSKNEFFALEDNGFGSKANSADFLLRIVRLRLDFKTRRGGAGEVKVVSSVVLTDPDRRAGFPLVRADRRLTGADFDPESLVIAPDGTFWIGEEFGPFLLHFSPAGTLLEAPFAIPNVASPDDPLKRPANLKSSRGFEGLALWPNGGFMFGVLEGALNGQDARRLPLYLFGLNPVDVSSFGRLMPDERFYRLDAVAEGEKPHSIGEMTCYGYNKFLVIERDGLEGEAARFKRIYAYNRNSDSKKLVIDLLRISDVNGLAGAKNSIYRMPFQTIESVAVLDKRHLLVCNDNNFPFGRGRGASIVEATEFAIVELDAPLF